MKKTKNGAYKFGRHSIFLNVGFWRLKTYHIGDTKVIRLGPVAIFWCKE